VEQADAVKEGGARKGRFACVEKSSCFGLALQRSFATRKERGDAAIGRGAVLDRLRL
jgi:hypothetical protein